MVGGCGAGGRLASSRQGGALLAAGAGGVGDAGDQVGWRLIDDIDFAADGGIALGADDEDDLAVVAGSCNGGDVGHEIRRAGCVSFPVG